MSVRSALARPIPAAVATTVLLLPVLVVMVWIWTGTSDPRPIDYGLFGPGGAALLTGRWSVVYGHAVIQAGPFELIPYGVIHLLGTEGFLGWTIALTVCTAATVFLAAIVLRPVLGPDLRSSVLAGAGALVLALAGPVTSIWALGHPAEVLVPLLWITAGRLAIRNHPVAAAALIAASSGFEVWGVLGAPVVLLATDVRLLRSAAAGAAVLAALWVPFLVVGPFRMFAFSWPVDDRSLLHLLDPSATSFPWSLRLLQSVVAVGAGAAVALLLRRSNAAAGPWAVTAAVVAARLILDPVLAEYYWDPVLVAGVGVLALAARRRDLGAAVAAALTMVLAAELAAPVARAAAITLIVVVAALLGRWRRSRRLVGTVPIRSRAATS